MAFGEVLFEEHAVSPKMPYLFNGKELDQDTGLYYYGARYYDPKVSLWLNVDPLVEKTMTPYAYTNNNPIMLVDPMGMESEKVDDIRLRDKNGNLIATYYTNKTDKDIYIKNVNIKKDINININKFTDKHIPDVDVIGISVGGEFTFGGGANVGLQYAYFLDGKDKGEGAYFYSVEATMGLSVGAGISVFAGNYIGSNGDNNMSMNDFLGNTQSYNLGVGIASGSYWWGNNLESNQPELYPGMGSIYENKNRKINPNFRYEQTWSGVSLGVATGPPQLKAGASLGHGLTKYLEWANKQFKTIPYTKGYQQKK